MILYGAPFSPFVQRVVLAARIKGVDLPVTPPPGGLASPEFAALSPMRRVPMLDDDGLLVCESMVIVAHLDETRPGPALLPADAAGRARARAIVSITEGEVVSGLRAFVTQKAFRSVDDPPALAAAAVQLDRGLDAIEQLIDRDGPWAAGAQPTIADIALVPMLVLAEVIERKASLPSFLGSRPALTAWFAHSADAPLFAPTAATLRTGFGAAVDASRQQQAQQQQ